MIITTKKRIKVKLKGLNPVQYRTKYFALINCLTFLGQYIVASFLLYLKIVITGFIL